MYKNDVIPDVDTESSKKGFTLIELLVVVLIIGILSSVALPQYQKAVEKSRAASVFANMQAIARMLDVYYLANGSYPDDRLDVVDIGLNGCTVAWGRIYCPDSWYDYNGGNNADGGRYENFSVVGYTRPFEEGASASWRSATTLIYYLSQDENGGRVTCYSQVAGVCKSLGFVTK